jgi:acrylyl-CoA reductase (NADPH)
MDTTFQALVIDQQGDGVTPSLRTLERDALPAGDVLVSVTYSSLNYKDGLAITNTAKIVRSFPMVPGVDLAGTVLESQHAGFQPGDEVVLTGWGIGERHWGGMAQLARVNGDWLVHLPAGLSLQQAMALGTAGFTAMLCVMALEDRSLAPGSGSGASSRDILVTGASGGVGSVAVAVLAQRGYSVAAATGSTSAHEYLRALGAQQIVDRGEITAPGGPLGSERWGGAVDTVGGETLAGVLRTLAYRTSVAACGNAGGVPLSTTVLPFILRGVSLLGVDSVMCPMPRRQQAWDRLAREVPQEVFERITQVVPLSAVPDRARAILRGEIQGRTVVDVNA